MSASTTIEGADYVPEKPILVVPNRLDLTALQALEQLLGGGSKVAWMAENSLLPEAEILGYLARQKSTRILVSAHRENLHESIRRRFEAGQHVVLLSGRPAQVPASPADVPAGLLHHVLTGYEQAVLPVYVGMFNPGLPCEVTTQKPYERMQLRVLPAVSHSTDLAAAVEAAWLGAGADMVSQYAEKMEETLPHALLSSLLANPRSVVIDGIDDTRMSYSQLLLQSVLLARKLRRIIINKRIGILLPPGKYAIIANVACLLAGICPVNIDYTYDGKAFKQLGKLADINRVITERRFIKREPQFPWPPERDIFLIDEENSGKKFRQMWFWNLIGRRLTATRLLKWVNANPAKPQDEALVHFTPVENSADIRGISLSHRAVLTGAAMCRSRYRMNRKERVLSALPLHYHAGLILGMLHPLLNGQDIITYPLPAAGKRLCELAQKYEAAMSVLTPMQARETLKHAQEGDFASTTYFLVAGRVPVQTAIDIYEKLHIYLCECYMPAESAMPLASNMPPPENTQHSVHSLPSGAPGAVGVPLPGVALRMNDVSSTDKTVPLTSLGVLWTKGPTLYTGQVEEIDPDSSSSAYEKWVCTGHMSQLLQNGLLTVGGPRGRYSRIGDDIVSHEKVEAAMMRYLHVEEEPGTPRLAIVGIKDAETGLDKLVLLSTVHQVVEPNAAMSMYYELTKWVNPETKRCYPGTWMPQHIIAVVSIPTLPGGRVDYHMCRQIAYVGLK